MIFSVSLVLIRCCFYVLQLLCGDPINYVRVVNQKCIIFSLSRICQILIRKCNSQYWKIVCSTVAQLSCYVFTDSSLYHCSTTACCASLDCCGTLQYWSGQDIRREWTMDWWEKVHKGQSNACFMAEYCAQQEWLHFAYSWCYLERSEVIIGVSQVLSVLSCNDVTGTFWFSFINNLISFDVYLMIIVSVLGCSYSISADGQVSSCLLVVRERMW